jgi:hypothetical protein
MRITKRNIQNSGRRISREGRDAMRQAGRTVGARNLEHWRAEHDVGAQETREDVARFQQLLECEVGATASAVSVGLVKSAIASYAVVAEVSRRLPLAFGRIGRLRSLHELLIEAQRNLFRCLNALRVDSESPAAQEARRQRVLAEIRAPEPTPTPVPLTPEQQAAADRKARREQAWREFANRGFEGEPPSERDEDYA